MSRIESAQINTNQLDKSGRLATSGNSGFSSKALDLSGCIPTDLKGEVDAGTRTDDPNDNHYLSKNPVLYRFANVSTDPNCQDVIGVKQFRTDRKITDHDFLESQREVPGSRQFFQVPFGTTRDEWIQLLNTPGCDGTIQVDALKAGDGLTLEQVMELPANQLFGDKMVDAATWYDPDCDPTPTHTPTRTPTKTHTPTHTPTFTPTPTPTETPTSSPTKTLTPTSTFTPYPTDTPRPTDTPNPTETFRPTETPRPTDTPNPTETSSATATVTSTATATETAMPTATSTSTPEPIVCIETDVKGDLEDVNHFSPNPVRGFVSNLAAEEECDDNIYLHMYGSMQFPETTGWIESQTGNHIQTIRIEVPRGSVDKPIKDILGQEVVVPNTEFCWVQVDLTRDGEIKETPRYINNDHVFVKDIDSCLPTATPTNTPTETPTNTPTETPTATATDTATATATNTPEATATNTRVSRTERVTKTPKPKTATATPSLEASPTPTSTTVVVKEGPVKDLPNSGTGTAGSDGDLAFAASILVAGIATTAFGLAGKLRGKRA